MVLAVTVFVDVFVDVLVGEDLDLESVVLEDELEFVNFLFLVSDSVVLLSF